MIILKMSDWSTYPEGVYADEGPSNAYTCRNYFLLPSLKLAERTNQVVEINISDVNYSASWLKAVFSKLNETGLSKQFLCNKVMFVISDNKDRYAHIVRELIIQFYTDRN